MAKTSKTCADFLRATKTALQAAKDLPFALFGTNMTMVYDETTYGHAFRKNSGTLPKVVRLHPVIARGAEMYRREGGLPYADAPDYQMVSKRASWKDANGKVVEGKEYVTELLYSDGSGLVVHKKGGDIRVSSMESDGTNNPIGEFKTLGEYDMAAIWMTCMPEIMEADKDDAHGKLAEKLAEYEPFFPSFTTWTATTVPELAKECAFYVSDVSFCYAEDHAKWAFAEASTAAIAEQVSHSITANGFEGSLVVTSNPNVAFKYAISNGNKDNGVCKQMTLGELIQEVGDFCKHRKFTAAERALIPSEKKFPDSTPVPDDVVTMARAFYYSRRFETPFNTCEWAGSTGIGKTHGTQMLARALGIPYVTLACNPQTETIDFKCNFVPISDDDDLEVDALAVTLPQDEDMDPMLRMAVDHVVGMTAEDRKALLSGTGFFMEAMMDPEGAAFSLFGKDVEMESEDLCRVYADTASYFRERALRVKLSQMESGDSKETSKREKPQGFKLVLSNYLLALINGYLCEVQEASRAKPGVLVGLNDYDHAGNQIQLLNGATARRHPDALVVFTDNVGYVSCREKDPSVVRRNAFRLVADELTESAAKDRIRRNTGCTDSALIDRAYNAYQKVKEFCDENSITGGSTSVVEFENLVKCCMVLGEDQFDKWLKICVITKATTDEDTQRDIVSAISLN